MTQRICYVFMSLCMLLASCRQEDTFKDAVAEDGNGNISFRISVPDELAATRASFGEQSNSARGGITNVDCANDYDLRYQLAVYRVIDDENFAVAIPPQKQVVDSYQPVTYSLRLTPNRKYKVVVWADFVKQGETDDLHYDTSDFKNITCIDSEDKQLNDESRDAYFITEEMEVKDDGISKDLVLKRPFAKVRIVATDWNLYNLEMPDNFKITYYSCKRFTSINAVTGAGSEGLADNNDNDNNDDDKPTVYTGSINKDEKEYALNYDLSEHNRTLTVDYLMTDKDEQTPIHIKFEALDGETLIASHDLKTNIPIKRNWLTTILGNILTVDAEFQISIDENFVNEWIVGEEWWNGQDITPEEPPYDEATKTYTISKREQFAWLPDHIDEMLAEKGYNFTIRLDNDIDMSGVEWKPIFPSASGKTYNIDGQGHTLRNFSMSGAFGAIYEYKIGSWTLGTYNAYTGVWGKFDGVMKNLTFENITINGLASAEFPVKDVDGNPVDHNKEYSYFAGCIGYTGGNQWSMNSRFENVHAKHIHIKSSTTPAQNLGGIVGWIGSGGGSANYRSADMTNCSATDIHITGYQAGGLVGQVLGDRGVSFNNCKTEYVYIRYNSISSSSGFIGGIGNLTGSVTATLEINDCTPAQNVYYINDRTGEANTTYSPQSPYYGRKNTKDVVTITNATDTDGDTGTDTP